MIEFNDTPFVPCNDCANWESCQEEAYQQGAKEFAEALRVNFDLLAWNNSDEVIDYTLKQIQKGAEE